MMIFSILIQALGFTVGTLLAATLFCWLCWTALKLVHHPELGVPLGLGLLLLFWRAEVSSSDFLRMTLALAALFAVALWPIGLAWRHDHNYPQR